MDLIKDMFDLEFYPTPREVADQMLSMLDVTWKVVLEPSAWKWDLVDRIWSFWASNVVTYETNKDLAQIVSKKSEYKGSDFFESNAEELSHIDCIVMNPPFSNAIDHINHAWDIAPNGCEIVALMNSANLDRKYEEKIRIFLEKIQMHWSRTDLGDVFKTAERKTSVQVTMITLIKPWQKDESFSEFFTDDTDREMEGSGLIPYNEVREVVSRYVNAIKLYDQMLQVWVQMNSLVKDIKRHAELKDDLVFTCEHEGKEMTQSRFQKQLQKWSWKWIFSKLDMQKYVTSSVYQKLNAHIEKYSNQKFTMNNIYRLLDVIIQTQWERMSETLLEAFEYITEHHHENRQIIEGWKTNKNYMVGKKFILPYLVSESYSNNKYLRFEWRWAEKLDDFQKALCYALGIKYEDTESFRDHIDEVKPYSWEKFDWFVFDCRAYNKGTVHFSWKDESQWRLFNKKVAEARGLELPQTV